MTAQEAYETAKKYWADNETKFLPYVVNFQQRIKEAAESGQLNATAAVIPPNVSGLIDFCADYFERLGYLVNFQNLGTGEIAIIVNSKNIPAFSKGYLETQKMTKFLSDAS